MGVFEMEIAPEALEHQEKFYDDRYSVRSLCLTRHPLLHRVNALFTNAWYDRRAP
jgi:hypothetical protein